jgi:cell division protein FtsQ
MSRVALSADRRFHRARVKPARRRAVWRRVAVLGSKYALGIAIVVLGASRVSTFLATAPVLQIDEIRLHGNERLSDDAVGAMLADLRGENILQADLDAWRARLMESPWVRDASFRRSLPSSLDVSIQEAAPVAIGRIGDRMYLVDERGSSIDEYGPQYGSLDLPIVDGFQRGDDAAAAAANAARGAVAARLIASLRAKPAIAERLSQVDVTDVHNVTVLLSNDVTELRLGEDHFLERLEAYLSLADALRERVPEIDSVDLRFDGRVYVRPLGKAARSSVGAGRPHISPVKAGQH